MKTRNTFLILLVLSVLVFGTSACGAAPTPMPIASIPGVTTLWTDVPPFPGAVPDLETNAFFNDSGQSNDGTITYFTTRQPSEVADFYTYKLMHAQAWEIPDVKMVKFFSQGGHGGGPEDQLGTQVGCSAFIVHDKPAASCWFNKTDETGHDVELSISVDPDRKDSSRFDITYSRMLGSLVPTPTP